MSTSDNLRLRTVVVYPRREALDAMADRGMETLMMIDMRFTVAIVDDFYRCYGRLSTLSKSDPVPGHAQVPEGLKALGLAEKSC